MMPRLRTREAWQNLESHWLAPYAGRSDEAHATRCCDETEHPYRTAFQRDRDRVIHSRAFRRLKHKRQVFLITEGDHFRTRLTHTLEVSQISRTIGRALGLNEDLLEAIALGHDLGHTPFGHLGETVLNDIMQGRDSCEGALSFGPQGGFKHNYQSLRIVDLLEHRYEFPGLNLTAPVREGILKHTRLKRGQFDYSGLDLAQLAFDLDSAVTLEGQVVATADEVAQRTHDFEDGIRAGLVALDQVRELTIVKQVEEQHSLARLLPRQSDLYRNRLINGLIDLLVTDIIQQSLKNLAGYVEAKGRFQHFDEELVCFSEEVVPLQHQLNQFIYQLIIFQPETRRSDEDARRLLRSLFRAYFEDPRLIPPDTSLLTGWLHGQGYDRPRRIADFIAGMTDSFAISEFERLRTRGLNLPQVNLNVLNKPLTRG